jgi:hypothetical protein
MLGFERFEAHINAIGTQKSPNPFRLLTDPESFREIFERNAAVAPTRWNRNHMSSTSDYDNE